MTTEETNELKRKYAANLLKYGEDQDNMYKAAFATTDDTGLALQIVGLLKWQNDLFVLEEKERLIKSGDSRSFLPTKEAQAKDIYGLATDPKNEVEDRLKAHRLYAEVMGHIEKPVPGVTNNILNQGVMIVQDAGTDDEWQEKATKQQQALIGHVN